MAQNFDVSLLVQQMAALQATIENMRTEHQKQVQNLEDQIRQVQQVQIIPENQRVAIEPKIVNESQVKLDVFKSLPVFDGNINSYRIWREDVTRMMETISDLSGQPIYAQALQIVKIQGSAAQLLANHGTIFNFMPSVTDWTKPMRILDHYMLSPEGKFTKTFGNEQRHQHQQRYQPQPRTELRPRPPLNNFQPRTQQYQSPRYNNHQPPPEPMDTSSGNTAYRQPTSPNPSITNHGKEEESQVGITEIINK
ncbi:Retrovirus-related Gag polyprotein from transposon gypsy [Eumeta japonica]|uniref:Retrovirus-related Gag polyprotein from transposon gypsy n=1 Tax=Eumeta variegata TaxID=151549 RepID=A0A4C1T5R3_EUMVA|nr:Retrovirus-related Gag polyprotein from transposon gypsy [Eumeta japonica]